MARRLENDRPAADVLLQNLSRVDGQARFSLEAPDKDYSGADLLELNHHRLCDEGPLSDRKAYYLLIQAESGLPRAHRWAGSPRAACSRSFYIGDRATAACLILKP